MGNKQVVEVYADYIYYAIIGTKERIDHTKNILKNANIEKYVEYYSLKTIIPLAIHKEILEQRKNLSIRLDTVVEEAQAHAFANYDSRESYMLVCLKIIDGSHILTFPRYVMVDGNDPEKGLIKEFSRLSNRKLDAILFNTIKPVAIINKDRDTILYVSKLVGRKSFDDENVGNILKLLDDNK